MQDLHVVHLGGVRIVGIMHVVHRRGQAMRELHRIAVPALPEGHSMQILHTAADSGAGRLS